MKLQGIVSGEGVLRKIISMGLMIVAVQWLVSCTDEAASVADTAVKQRPATSVVTWVAVNRALTEQLEFIGALQGNESVSLTAKVTEQVAAVHFQDGQFVEAGDIIVELTNAAQNAELNEATVNLDEANLNLGRLQKLTGAVVTATQIDQATARAKGAQARLEVIAVKLGDRLIRAPFSGVLGFRQVSKGALVTPGTVIAELDDISSLKLDFNVPERYLGKVTMGGNIEALSQAWPEQPFRAQVSTIASRVDRASGSIAVRALLNNSEGLLRPGMAMNVWVDLSERAALIVPEQALIQDGRKSYLYITEAGQSQLTARRLEVELGKRVPGGIEIVAGLELGAKVIISGHMNLRPGSAIAEVDRQGRALPAAPIASSVER